MANILVEHCRSSGSSWATSVWTPTCWIIVRTTIWKNFVGNGIAKSTELGMLVCFTEKQGTMFICICGWHLNGRKEAEYGFHVESIWWKMLILMNQHHFLIMYSWDALSVNANRMKILWNNTKRCSNHVFLQEQRKCYQGETNLTQKQWRGPMTCRDVLKSALYDIAIWQTRRQSSCTSLRVLVDEKFVKKEELESVGELWEVSTQIVLKCLYLAQIGKPDILWSVNKLALSVTNWTQASDRRLARLISDIHHTRDYRQYCHVGNAAQHCRLGWFQDSAFRWWPWGLEINIGEIFVYVEVVHLFQLVGCARSKHQYLPVPQNRQSSHRMLDCEWMDYFWKQIWDRRLFAQPI